MTVGGSASIDLDGNGLADFTLGFSPAYGGGATTALLDFSAAGTASALGGGITTQILLSDPSYVARYNLGDTISAGLSGEQSYSGLVVYDNAPPIFYAVRLHNDSIGFFSLAYKSSTPVVEVGNFTFESVPDTDVVVSTPEPTSLASLAVGAAGALLRRRRPAATATE